MNDQPFIDTRNFSLVEAKRFFLRIGIAILLQRMIWIVLANVMAIVVYRVAPDVYNTWWFPWLYNDLPHYLVAIPLCFLVMPRKIDVDSYVLSGGEDDEQTPRFGIGKMLIALIVCFSGMYIFALIGEGVNSIINLLSGGMLGNTDALNDLISATPWYVTIVGTCILAPIIEEIVFRKWIIDRARPFGEFAACLLSGILFGLFHGNFLQGFYTTALGLIFAYVYIRTKNIWYTIAMHSIINLFGSVIIPGLLSNENITNLNLILKGTVTNETILSLVLVLITEFLIFAAVVAGVVLFFVFVRKLVFKKPLLDTGVKPTKLMFGNAGVIAAIIVFSIAFIVALL